MGNCTLDMRNAIADFMKHICINKIKFQNNTTSLEIYIASGLLPLHKNPCLRPTGVGEVLRRIVGKIFMSLRNHD